MNRCLVVVAVTVRVASADVKLPPVPSFEIPVGDAGFHTVRELRVVGTPLLDTEIKVKGYVTWIYDCVADVIKPHETQAQAQQRIDDDQTLCQRPKFYVGDARDTAADVALWVVDVPRLPTKMELKMLSKDELAARPPVPVPKLAVGDYVAITGKFTRQSAHSEMNSDGLLVYKALEHVAPSSSAARGTVKPPALAMPTPPTPRPGVAPITNPAVVVASKRLTADGNRAVADGHWDVAVDAYTKALAGADGNHVAWYGLGYARFKQQDWKQAIAAFDKAVQLAPAVAVYEVWLGMASYQDAVSDASERQARVLGRKPDDVVPDLSATDFRPALRPLLIAIALDPTLWHGHYYLGRIHRDNGRARDAAAAFGKAIVAQPAESGPYIALAMIYLRWDFADEAIAVASAGTANVTGPDVSDIWYVLGQAYEAKREAAKAIDAYTHALDARKDNHKAKFQRGQAYHRLVHDNAKAAVDLRDFVAGAGPRDELSKAIANRILMDIAARKP